MFQTLDNRTSFFVQQNFQTSVTTHRSSVMTFTVYKTHSYSPLPKMWSSSKPVTDEEEGFINFTGVHLVYADRDQR